MDKNFILRLESSLKAIKRKLLANEKIRTLLYYDSEYIDENQTNLEIPSIQLVKDNIFLQPVVSNDIDPPFNKKNYIAISTSALGFVGGSTLMADYAVKVIIMIHKTNWIYGDNNIRVLHLMQEVINEIDGYKADCSNAFEYEQAIQTVIDESITGYSIIFSIVDGLGETDKD